jgi:hypothetical protein
MKLLFAIILFIGLGSVANAQEAFSPFKAAKDPNYLKKLVDPNYNPNADDILPPPTIGEVESMDLEPEISPQQQTEPETPSQPIFTKSATFTVVNKRLGKSETFDAQIGINVISDKLEMHPVRCYVQEVKGIKQQAALVEIFAPKDGNARALIYSGWLSANYPYATPVSHPQYDVFLQECIVDVEDNSEESSKADKQIKE